METDRLSLYQLDHKWEQRKQDKGLRRDENGNVRRRESLAKRRPSDSDFQQGLLERYQVQESNWDIFISEELEGDGQNAWFPFRVREQLATYAGKACCTSSSTSYSHTLSLFTASPVVNCSKVLYCILIVRTANLAYRRATLPAWTNGSISGRSRDLYLKTPEEPRVPKHSIIDIGSEQLILSPVVSFVIQIIDGREDLKIGNEKGQ